MLAASRLLSSTLNSPRILLCASAAHCAQVLQAAAAARVNVHGLQPCTEWPASNADNRLLLWALIPASHPQARQATALEQHWRTRMLQGEHGFTIHMLYGDAEQQARQLAPWARQHPSNRSDNINHHSPANMGCRECLDASSEQTLFQHLISQSQPSHSE